MKYTKEATGATIWIILLAATFLTGGIIQIIIGTVFILVNIYQLGYGMRQSYEGAQRIGAIEKDDKKKTDKQSKRK